MQLIVVAGPVSTGKTTSLFPNETLGITGLPPAEMCYITCAGAGKEVPMRGWKTIFQPEKSIKDGGQFKRTSDTKVIGGIIDYVIEHRPDIKYLVIDDLDYAQALKVVGTVRKFEFEDWRTVAVEFFGNIINKATADNSRDLTIILQFHTELKGEGGDMLIKTSGKMIDNYIQLEGLFSWVFYTYTQQSIVEGKPKTAYNYLTNRLGNLPAKSLPGAFEDTIIPADMGVVVRTIKAYQETV